MYGLPGGEVGGGANDIPAQLLLLTWCGAVCGAVYDMPWSAAAAAKSPVPSVPSSGGGVFSRCLIGSGAAGAAGLYGSGATFSGPFFSSAWVWCSEFTCGRSACGPLGGGGGKLIVCWMPCETGAVTAVGLERELGVCPFWYAGSETATFSSCWTTELNG